MLPFCVTGILCYPLVYVHCGPVVDFFITKQTSLHPFDFVRNLFHLLCILLTTKKRLYCTTVFNCNTFLSRLAYKEFDQLNRSVFILSIATHSQFNLLSGGLTECLSEPWHVGVSTAGSLHTRTLLSIP